MKLATFTYKGKTQIGTIDDDTIHVVAWQDSMRQLIRRGITPSRTYEKVPLAEATLNAPLVPGKIIAIGRNYAAHAAETGDTLPEKPLIFAKFPSAVIGTGETVTWHTSITQQVDWEVELAVIIGRRAQAVSEDEALDHVFGYCIANDVSARDLQLRTDGQWTRGKSLDTFCPLGPYIVTRDEIADPNTLPLKLTINDEVMQDDSTSNMVFKVPHLVSYSSRMFTLEPGDLILTGTPSGVGEGRKPPRYLADGDVMVASIEGIGSITNPCKVIED